ncbi:precorrin-3B synthase [Paractinoplanes ovalisporus]|uniref:precorrin-3B synthase n=1 Tax=Paractinoplanes ovalisporus TaxID=2810368 RepID=UPI0027DB1126|nr:precorrin-3B synthase [Actinoplanes ovalisporus]
MPARESPVDACPGALRLHKAADGPLARVRLPGGMLTGPQLTALASLAAAFGDGHLELTSRANVQLRALREADPAVLAARLSAAGLLPSETHETVRNIAAPPLADATIRALVTDLDRALCATPALAALPGRFLFAIGPTTLDADVAALPVADEAFAILFAGHDAGLRVAADGVVAALLAAANAFLAERAAQAGSASDAPAWRLHELPNGPARVAVRTAAVLGLPTSTVGAGKPADAPPASVATDGLPLFPPPLEPVRQIGFVREGMGDPTPTLTPAPTLAPAPAPIGVVRQGDGLVAVGALVPLGRLGGEALRLLATARRLVVTPWRGVVVPDLTPEAARRWARALDDAGLPVDPTTRWAGVTACAGRPGCAKSLADVRADADSTSAYSDGLPVHWIGCARGCGSPSGPHVRVEATPSGYAVTRQPDEEMFTGDTARAVAAARRI